MRLKAIEELLGPPLAARLMVALEFCAFIFKPHTAQCPNAKAGCYVLYNVNWVVLSNLSDTVARLYLTGRCQLVNCLRSHNSEWMFTVYNNPYQNHSSENKRSFGIL